MGAPEVVSERLGRFAVRWDNDRASVLIDAEGFWSEEDTATFCAAVKPAAARSRARHGYALLLFDASKNEILGDAPAAKFQSDEVRFTEPGDRVAIVVQSSLNRLQMKRLTKSWLIAEFFICTNAADTWLHANIDRPA